MTLAALPPLACAVTTDKVTPPASVIRPSAVRMTPRPVRSTAVPASASVGRIRLARRLATHAAMTAMSRATDTATSGGSQETRSQKLAGAIPRETNWSRSQPTPARPGQTPAAPASRPRIVASRTTIRRTCRGVAAIARSRAISRCRCVTDKPTVPAITSTAISTADPPATAETAMTAPALSRRRRSRRRRDRRRRRHGDKRRTDDRVPAAARRAPHPPGSRRRPSPIGEHADDLGLTWMPRQGPGFGAVNEDGRVAGDSTRRRGDPADRECLLPGRQPEPYLLT